MIKNKRLIAYGEGNAFINYVLKYDWGDIKYAVDDNPKETGYCCINPKVLFSENPDEVFVIIFTLSSDVYQKIAKKLSKRGFDYADYSVLIRKQFKEDMKKHGIKLRDEWYSMIHSLFCSMPIANHSSLLGSWMITGLLDKTKNVRGDCIELGCYQGGLSYCASMFLKMTGDKRKYYMVDNFEGFNGKFTDNSYKKVYDRFSQYDNVEVIKADISNELYLLGNKDYSFAYIDCDLCTPTLESLRYAYSLLSKGGIILIDDYCVAQGFLEVKKIVDYFCYAYDIDIIEIPETTHGLIIK